MSKVQIMIGARNVSEHLVVLVLLASKANHEVVLFLHLLILIVVGVTL